MTRAPYSVTVQVAGLTWVAEFDPAADPAPAPTLGPVAPMTLRESLPDKPVPAQPDPPIATFGLAAADAADLAGVVKGADCHLIFTATGNPDPIFFDGNVSDVVLTPAKVRDGAGGPLVFGVIAQVVAVGYLAQLFDETATVDEPVEIGPNVSALDRMVYLFGDSPWTFIEDMPLSDWVYNDRRKPKSIANEALGPNLVEVFDSHPVYASGDLGGKPLGRIVVRPSLESDYDFPPGGLFYPRTLRQLPDASWAFNLATGPAAIAPGVFGDAGAGYGVTFPAAAGDDPLINGQHVDRAISFVQRKGTNVTKTIVRYADADGEKARSTSRDNGVKPSTTHTIETDIIDAAGDIGAAQLAGDIATMYLPPANLAAWGVDEIVWRLYDDVAGRKPPPLGQLIVIAPLPVTQNPNGREWLTGLVAGWLLTIAGGRPTVTLTLRTGGSPDATAAGSLTVDELPNDVTVDQLNPTHTIDDYALLGG